ncbi:hypothetical protein T4A_12802, partial [Trichinella pseudospiralis]
MTQYQDWPFQNVFCLMICHVKLLTDKIFLEDGSKQIPSDALPLPSGQKDRSGSSSPTHTSVPGLPIQK